MFEPTVVLPTHTSSWFSGNLFPKCHILSPISLSSFHPSLVYSQLYSWSSNSSHLHHFSRFSLLLYHEDADSQLPQNMSTCQTTQHHILIDYSFQKCFCFKCNEHHEPNTPLSTLPVLLVLHSENTWNKNEANQRKVRNLMVIMTVT
jgi:hypothetical protein